MPIEDFRELTFEGARVHHLSLRSSRRELVVACQQPPILPPRDTGEFDIFRFGTEVEAVIAAQPKPASEGTEHRVAEKTGVGRGLSHGVSRIPTLGHPFHSAMSLLSLRLFKSDFSTTSLSSAAEEGPSETGTHEQLRSCTPQGGAP